MARDLERFLNSIGYPIDRNSLINTEIEKVLFHQSDKLYEVILKDKNILPYSVVKELNNCSKNKINGKDKCEIKYHFENVNEESILEFIKEILINLTDKKPSLKSILEKDIELNNKTVTIQVGNKAISEELKKEWKKVQKILFNAGIEELELNTSLDEAMQSSVKEEIQKEKDAKVVVEETKKIEGNLLMGKEITGDVVDIDSIMGSAKSVIIEGYVFGIDTMERENINIITLKMSDLKNSLLVKIFKKDRKEYLTLVDNISSGSWYKVQGGVEYDTFAKDFVLAARNMERIPSKSDERHDDAETPRVEMHLHTMMSAMDGVINADGLIKKVAALGQKAVAITDHNCVQSFPDLYHGIQAYNKGKEGKDRFKVLYGAEMNVVNDDIDIIYNFKDLNLLEETFVVFDTETTGFYAGSDQMIEIGAVKISKGEIIDRFDELIDPHHPIPKKITELTEITDEMLQGRDNEEEVTKRFFDFIGDLPLVAHNAKFDISFMKAAVAKYNLKDFNNTVLDTMALARMLHPEWPNHKLQTLTKRLDIPWDEDKHHRADYDAEGTSLAFYKMIKSFSDQNINTTKELIDNIDMDSLVKFAFPFHATMIAQNRVGLKNLFKIVSIANTKYLYKNEQPKIPRKEVNNLREGLLIGSGCIHGEIFDKARGMEDEELVNMMSFYDYIEVQPISAFSHLIGPNEKFMNIIDAEEYIKRIVRVAKEAGKPVVASGDVHNFSPNDLIYREIIINQKFNGKLHPLKRNGLQVPNMYLKTTAEMLKDFEFLGEDLAYEIVVTNTNKIADMVEEVEVIIDTKGIPFAPKIENSQSIVTEMVYKRAHDLYGDPLPYHLEERIAMELYGAPFVTAVKKNGGTEEEMYARMNKVIMGGPESVQKEIYDSLRIDDKESPEEDLMKEAKKKMTAIIGANFDVIYLIAQKLVKHSNDEGFLVGSRGSVGSSFVAYLMGITEVNSLAPHYRCPKCKRSFFNDEGDKPLTDTSKCGFDLPDRKCPDCKVKMTKDGHDIPFETFLGFNADKVPDIDLNFSDLNQASAHEYTKVLFGVDNVYRAGTIGTVAEKTAYGYVKGYCEEKNIMMRNIEIERLAIGCTGVKRTTGQHPGGIVVIPGYMEVFDFTAFQYPAEDPTSAWRTTHFDYHAIDECVLKLDILGHTDPTQLRMIQDLTGDDITKVPLDDKDTMSIFTSTKALGVTKEQIMCDTGTLGVPEFGTPFTIQLVKDAKPTTFAELVKIAGLAHGTDVWLNNAQELIQKNIVPFDKVIGCRDDIMVELIYRGLEPFKAFKIMEFVRKGKASKPKEQAQWAEYVDLMKKEHIPDWFINSCAKIKYMFPKAHAAAYVTSAFRIAWYKVHKPLVYYATYFSTRFQDFDIDSMVKGYDEIKKKMVDLQAKGYDITNKEASVLETLKLALEATARGIKFKQIDIARSDGANFVMDEADNALILPFRALDGLGDSVANKIIEERNNKPFYSIEDFGSRGKVNQTTVDKMRSMGIFAGMPETSQLSLF